MDFRRRSLVRGRGRTRSGARTGVVSPALAALSIALCPLTAPAQEGNGRPAGDAPLTAEQAIGRAEEAPMVVPRLDAPLHMDAERDAPVWDAIEPLPVIMMIPDFGGAPTERTEFRVAHDGEYLYFNCRAYDSEPHLIQAQTLQRDEGGWGSDRCGLYLDTLNDGENSVGFITTPAATLTELAYSNEGTRYNIDWNTFWDVSITEDENGWYADFRVPFSSLLFQPEPGGRVVMGLSLLRSVARKNERMVYPAIPPFWGNVSHTRPSEMRKVVFEGVVKQDPVYVTPYSLGGGGYSHTLNAPGTAWDRDSDRVTEVGLDVKYSLTSNLTLDLTVNPDFAQVEADDQQVNLTRFSLFFPEKRRFFQERSSIFEYSLGSNNERIFHSRQVGLANGQPVRIFGGARLVGRIGEWDVGVINMQTEDSELLPSENQAVARLRRRVLNSSSYLGGILTSRIGTNGEYNAVYGLDATLRLLAEDYLTLNWAQSFDDADDDQPGGVDLFDRSVLRLNWARPREDGLNYGLDLVRAGERFEPAMGFLRRRDYTAGRINLGHGWRPTGESRFRTYSLSLATSAFRRNQDQIVETVEIAPQASFETRGAHGFTLNVPLNYENLERGFRLSDDVRIPAGIYRFGSVRLSYNPPQGSLLKAGFSVETGRFYDGHQTSFGFRPSWSASRHLQISTGYSLDRIEFPDRDQRFTAHVGSLRTQVYVSTKTSAMAFVQYNSADDAVVANFRFHYKPREGNDFYLVWNEGLLTDRYRFAPAAPGSQARTILLKYSHTFRLGI